MNPILFSIGPLTIYNLSIFLIISWCISSFLFWRHLRSSGIAEEKIFDLMFYSSLGAFIGSRLVFVIFNWQIFKDTPLKIAALWVQPGLSFYGAIVSALIIFLWLCRKFNLNFAHVADAFTLSLIGGIMFGCIGTLLDGTEVGLPTNLFFAVRYIGFPEKRHPVQIYEILLLLAFIIIFTVIEKKKLSFLSKPGKTAINFSLYYSVIMIFLEYLKDSPVYWGVFRINQIFLIILFGQSVGFWYILGDGRKLFCSILLFINQKSGNAGISIKKIFGGMYAKFKQLRFHKKAS